MSKVSIMTLEKAQSAGAQSAGAPERCRDRPEATAYFDGEDSPLHLHLHEIQPGDALRIAAGDLDRLGYVWRGCVTAGGRRLDQGSSLIVEHGRSLDVAGGPEASLVLTFAPARPPARPREGGHIHLLPAERVPRYEAQPGSSGVRGGMHADSACPTCELWLHENHFPGSQPPAPKDAARGVHSHSEDEIIFVTAGAIRLGAKLYGPGTALAIAADTLYSFTPGSEGLSFINFRAATPGDIQFVHGAPINEIGYWRERTARPDYLAPV